MSRRTWTAARGARALAASASVACAAILAVACTEVPAPLDASGRMRDVVTPDGEVYDRYEKVRRVPFGEYMPMRGLLDALGAPTDLVPRDAVAGHGPAVLTLPDGTSLAFGDTGVDRVLDFTAGEGDRVHLVHSQDPEAADRLAALIEERRKLERELTEYSRALVPALPFPQIDVLIVDKGGKDISGTTMDPNVTGRFWVHGLADMAEPLGFDSIWSVEHHFTDYTMCPDVVQFLSYMAGRTKHVRLGSMVVVLPWHDPMRVAEEVSRIPFFADKPRSETYVLGDSPLVTLTALQTFFEPDPASSSYSQFPTPRLALDGTYGDNPAGRPMRVYTRIDTRLTFADMVAKFRAADAALKR